MSQQFFPAKIIHRIQETEDAITFYLQPSKEDFPQYKSGQYIAVRFDVHGEKHTRYYSLSSSPYSDQNISITIKIKDQNALFDFIKNNLTIGQQLETTFPSGSFTIDINKNNNHHYVLLSAGSGITPLFSVLKSVLHQEQQSKVTLYYGNRNEESIIFKKQLDELKQQFKDRFWVHYILSQPNKTWNGLTGRINNDFVTKWIHDIQNVSPDILKSYWLSGPKDMVDNLEKLLLDFQIEKHNIRREQY